MITKREDLSSVNLYNLFSVIYDEAYLFLLNQFRLRRKHNYVHYKQSIQEKECIYFSFLQGAFSAVISNKLFKPTKMFELKNCDNFSHLCREAYIQGSISATKLLQER